MKISSFRPMDLYAAQSTRQQAAPAKPDDGGTVRTTAAETPSASSPRQADVITQEEKQYFAQLYPNDSQKITSYSTYSKNGVTKEHSVGSLIDKKS